MTDRRTLAATLTAFVAVAAVAGVTRLIPEGQRPYNLTAIGALALFAAARIGFWQSLAVVGAAMFASDLVLWREHNFDGEYLPIPIVYIGFAIYAILGWCLLRRTENPLKIGGVALLGGAVFFLLTNFFSWLGQALPYGFTPGGLLTCYEMGLPFYRGTVVGDLLFSGVLFGGYAVLSRAGVRTGVVQTAKVQA